VAGVSAAAAVNGRDWGDVVVVGATLVAASCGCRVVEVVDVVAGASGMVVDEAVSGMVVVVVVQLQSATSDDDPLVAPQAAPPAAAPSSTSAMIELTIVTCRFIAALSSSSACSRQPAEAHYSPSHRLRRGLAEGPGQGAGAVSAMADYCAPAALAQLVNLRPATEENPVGAPGNSLGRRAGHRVRFRVGDRRRPGDPIGHPHLCGSALGTAPEGP
jgi:hypothetical protein